LWNASVTVFESKARSTWSRDISRNHCRAYNNPKASPRGTEHLGEKLNVSAKTKVPSASWIQIRIHVLFREFEKEASTLHFSLPCMCGAVKIMYISHFDRDFSFKIK
jgi:hypothetical protein